MSNSIDTAVAQAESILIGRGDFARELLAYFGGAVPEGHDKYRVDCPGCGAHAMGLTLSMTNFGHCWSCGLNFGWRLACERFGLSDRGMGYARLVCERAGVELQLSPQAEAEYRAAERATDVREAAYRIMQRWLFEDRGAEQLAYLRDGRGLSDDEIRGMGFGAHVSWLDLLAELVNAGFKSGDVEGCGLNTSTKADDAPDGWYRYGETHTVALPVYNRIGRLVSFTVRSLPLSSGGDYKRKWIHSAGSKPSQHLFNVHAVRGEQRVLIAESPLCALRSTFHGIPCVATAGASGFQPVHVEQLLAAGCTVAVLGFDSAGDAAGRKATRNGIRLLTGDGARATGIVCVVADFPCKDPDETIGIEGADTLRECVANAISAASWEGRDLLRDVDMTKPVQRDPLLALAAKRYDEIARVNPLHAEDFAAAVAEAAGIDREGVRIAVTGESHYSRLAKILDDAARGGEHRQPLDVVLPKLITSASELAAVSAPPVDAIWGEQAIKPVWEWHERRYAEVDEYYRNLYGKSMTELTREQLNKGRPPAAYRGLHMGNRKLQRMTGGGLPGTVIVIGGRTTMGKTEYACDLTRIFAIEQNIPVGWVSLETDADVLSTRIMLCDTYSGGRGVELYDFENPHRMDSVQHSLLIAARRRYDRAPIDIDDKSRALPAILRSIRRMAKGGCAVVFIDYLQLIGTMAGSAMRHLDLGEATRELHNLARELKIVIVELAQLNRGTEMRDKSGKQTATRPTLADFRESDSIAHDAEVVIFPYRPAYYKANDPNYSLAPWELETDAELILAKNKRGRLGVIPCYRVPEVGRWLEPDRPGERSMHITKAISNSGG